MDLILVGIAAAVATIWITLIGLMAFIVIRALLSERKP